MAGGPSEVDKLEARRKRIAAVREKIVEVRMEESALARITGGIQTRERLDIVIERLADALDELIDVVASLE